MKSCTTVRLALFYLIIFTLNQESWAQEGTYRLSPALDIPLLTAGVAGTTTSILLRNKREPISVEDLGKLNLDDILAVDRATTSNYGEPFRVASDVFLSVSYAFPLTLLAFEDIRADAGTIGVILAETVLLNEAATGITKALVARPRPYTYNAETPEAVRISRDNNFSFFSGHTSYSAALSFFTAKTIHDYVDRPGVRTLAWTGAILWPAATGFFRYKAGKHFPTDVLVGYAVGASLGILIPHLHKQDEDMVASGASNSVLPLVPNMFTVTLVF